MDSPLVQEGADFRGYAIVDLIDEVRHDVGGEFFSDIALSPSELACADGKALLVRKCLHGAYPLRGIPCEPLSDEGVWESTFLRWRDEGDGVNFHYKRLFYTSFNFFPHFSVDHCGIRG